MRVFVLEDNADRVKWFMDAFSDHSLTIVNHADAAMAVLRTVKFGVLFLDHDLGGKAFVPDTDFNTGSTVAKMIDETENKTAAVVVHSWNIEAGKGMVAILKASGHDGKIAQLQFGKFTKNILYNAPTSA